MSRSVVVAALMALGLFAPSLAEAADQLSTSDRLDDRRFVTIGPRAYELGTEAGRYPAAGFHTRGEMGGVWTPPIKLVDGIWFGVGDEWIGPASRFTSGWGHVKMRLPRTGGLRVERTDFVPGERRGVLVGLKLSGKSHQTVDLRMQTHSELMSIYPWGETTPSQTDFNQPDSVAFQGRELVFGESGTPPVTNAIPHDWGAAVGSALTPTGHQTGDGFRGPQEPVEEDELCGPSGPNTPPTPDALRRHRLRQGQGRRAHLRGQAATLRRDHGVVRRRRLRVRHVRRPRRAAQAARRTRARAAREAARARGALAAHQARAAGRPAARARHRVEQAESRRLGAGGARPRAA